MSILHQSDNQEESMKNKLNEETAGTYVTLIRRREGAIMSRIIRSGRHFLKDNKQYSVRMSNSKHLISVEHCKEKDCEI